MDNNPHLPGTAEEFITANMGFARSIAWKFANRGDIDDIMSIAYWGLVKSYQGFDPTKRIGIDGKEIHFATYASSMISGYIQTFLRQNNHMIKIGRGNLDVIYKMYSSNLNGTETPEEIVKKLGFSLDEVNKALIAKSALSIDSMDREVSEGEGFTLWDVIGEGDKVDEDKEILKEFASTIPAKLKNIYDLMLKEKNQREIAEILGISQSYVARLAQRITKLAASFGERMGGNEMQSKYPDNLRNRVNELASTGTAKEIYEIIKMEFPDIDIPYTTVTTWISHSRKKPEKPKVLGNNSLTPMNSEVTERMVTPEEAERYGIKVVNDSSNETDLECGPEMECGPECEIPEPNQDEPNRCETEPRKEIKVDPKYLIDIKQVLVPNKTVKVRWLDGYLEEFEVQEVRAGAHLLWIRLKNGDTRHIPLAQVRWFNGVA